MLGARTKQVFSYGRRGHRIVNVSEDHENFQPVNTNNKDKDADPWRTPVALKTRMRQHFPSESPSPQLVRMHNRTSKKLRSPSLSPASLKKKRKHTRQAIKSDLNSKSKGDDTTLSRLPLSSYHPNVPGSPPIFTTKKKARVAGSKGTPMNSRLAKPFSPFVDMEIIVLDDQGRRVSQERRVSRTDVVINPPATVVPTRIGKKIIKKKPELDVNVISDSEGDVAPKPPKRGGGRVKTIVISSDESEVEELPSIPDLAKAKALKTSQSRPRLEVEVVIPLFKHVVKPKSKLEALPPPERQPSPPITVPKYIPIPFPQPSRARQLTPIRRGGSKAFFRAPSPSTPTDFDDSLDFDFSSLSLTPSQTRQPSIPEYLLPLLDECAQTAPHEFSAFIGTFPFDPIVQPIDEDLSLPNDVQFRKIGEASYSEVFGIGNVVLKVIPLRDDTSASAPTPISEPETPFPSEAKDVLKEIIVTRAMGEMCDGFVKLLRTYIVRGKYPELLLALWDEYDRKKGSEGVRPDGFNLSQVYAIIVLPNGGPDLEAYTFANASKNGWKQASSLFWQVAQTLSQAEALVEFEHRDLHWGQILIKNTVSSTRAPSRRKSKTPMDDPSHGIEATIIDLGLARMNDGEEVHWTPFDDEIFEGEGDYQFDVYRMMKGGVGMEYRPITNVMWLHYLVLKLLHAKRLKAPNASRKPAALSGYTERECYESLLDVEAMLGKCIKDATVTKRKAKKVVADNAGPILKSAGDVVKYAAERGWVQ